MHNCTPSQPPSHVTVAKTCYATRRAGNKLWHITHARHTPSRHNTVRHVRAANLSYFRHFPTSLAPSFSDTRGSLNFLSVHSCCQNSDKLYVCVEVSTKTNSVRLNFHHWCKTPSSAFSKKKNQRRLRIFCTFSVEPIVIYNCALYN